MSCQNKVTRMVFKGAGKPQAVSLSGFSASLCAASVAVNSATPMHLHSCLCLLGCEIYHREMTYVAFSLAKVFFRSMHC